jgi:hypothetical protein
VANINFGWFTLHLKVFTSFKAKHLDIEIGFALFQGLMLWFMH